MAKRRELRDREDGGERRRSRPRRSMSTGALPPMEPIRSDAPARPSSLAISASTFNVSFAEGLSTDLDSIRRSVDVRRRRDRTELTPQQSYRTHERQHGRLEYGEETLSSVTTVGSAGDVHSRAWRRVRSPADMQDRLMRHASKSARGVVYVKRASRDDSSVADPLSEATGTAWRPDPAAPDRLRACRLGRPERGADVVERAAAHGAERAAGEVGVRAVRLAWPADLTSQRPHVQAAHVVPCSATRRSGA